VWLLRHSVGLRSKHPAFVVEAARCMHHERVRVYIGLASGCVEWDGNFSTPWPKEQMLGAVGVGARD